MFFLCEDLIAVLWNYFCTNSQQCKKSFSIQNIQYLPYKFITAQGYKYENKKTEVFNFIELLPLYNWCCHTWLGFWLYCVCVDPDSGVYDLWTCFVCDLYCRSSSYDLYLGCDYASFCPDFDFAYDPCLFFCPCHDHFYYCKWNRQFLWNIKRFLLV